MNRFETPYVGMLQEPGKAPMFDWPTMSYRVGMKCREASVGDKYLSL